MHRHTPKVKLKKNYSILAMLGLCCSAQAFHCCDFSCGAWLLGMGLSSCNFLGFRAYAQWLWCTGLFPP